MKLKFIAFFIFLNFVSVKAQTYEKDWVNIYKKMEANLPITIKEYEAFEKKHEKFFEKNTDDASKFYSFYAFELLNNKDEKNALEALKYSYHYATKSTDTTLKYIVTYRFGDYYNRIGNYIEAEKYYYSNMYAMSAILGASSREYSNIYFEYTQVLMYLQKYTEAKPAVEGLMYYYKTLDEEKSDYYVILINYMAIIHQHYSEYDKAITIYNKLISESTHLNFKDTAGHIEKYSSLGDVYREMGKYDDALFNFKKAKQEFYRLHSTKKSILASLENNLGLCYKILGLTKEAEEAFNISLKIYEEIKETNGEDYCITLNNKGDFFRELGRKGEASEILLKSLAIRKNNGKTTTRSYANNLNNLGLVYIDAQLYEEAFKRLLEAKDVYLKTVGESHQFYGNCLNNLSSCYFYTGNYVKAEEYKLQALSIVEKTVGKNHFRYPTFLISTSTIYFKTKQWTKAENNLKEALLLIEKNFGKNHDLYANAQLALAEIYIATNRFEQAGELYVGSINHYSKQLNTYFDAMSEGNQGEFLNTIEPLFESYNTFLLNYKLSQPTKNINSYIKIALNNQILLKSLIGKKASKLQQIVANSNNAETINLYQELIATKNTLINNSKSAEKNYDENTLLQKIGSIENALKAKLPDFKPQQATSFEEIKTALNNNEATVELFKVNEWINDSTSKKMYGAIVIKNNSINPELVVFKNGNDMDGIAFDNYTKAIDEQLQDTLSYNYFFKQLKPIVTNCTKLYISADGIFQKINLAAIYNSTTKKYIGDGIDIVNVTNISNIVEKNLTKTTSNNLNASLFGYPDFDYDFKKKLPNSDKNNMQLVASRYGLVNLSTLPGTKKEVEDIATELQSKNWKVNVYTQEKASEANLRKIISPNVLHIATHGYYLKDVETTDKLFLGFENNALKENSFLRSGLILAGVGPATNDSLNTDSENDGIVTAYEACVLNLSNTNLVVLSACQTGLGDNMGTEGVAGLQRSLAVAGAKNLIMSLWPVDDNATQFLMTEFYKHYSSTQNAEESFKKAKATTKLKYPHPYYWAAFILIKTFN